jgi:hypothetical protein
MMLIPLGPIMSPTFSTNLPDSFWNVPQGYPDQYPPQQGGYRQPPGGSHPSQQQQQQQQPPQQQPPQQQQHQPQPSQ